MVTRGSGGDGGVVTASVGTRLGKERTGEHNPVGVLNATEPFTLKWLKCKVKIYVHFTSFRKKKKEKERKITRLMSGNQITLGAEAQLAPYFWKQKAGKTAECRMSQLGVTCECTHSEPCELGQECW